MSRCFPFPPPAYEKKARPDNSEFLEEKLREKKHKKEKDKEKKEGKEKREKDRSDKKQREKRDKKEKHKDKKEKHRDKKKDKEDRDKEGDVASTSGVKDVSVQSEGYTGKKLNGKQERGKDKSGISFEKKPAVLSISQNGQEPDGKTIQSGDIEGFKFVLDLGKRIRGGQEGRRSPLVEKPTYIDRKKEEEIGRYAVKDTAILAEFVEQKRDGEVECKKTSDQGVRDVGMARSSGNAVIQNLAGTLQDKTKVPKPMEKNIERKIDGKGREKSEDKDDSKRQDKRKDKEREKKSHGKDREKDKEKKNKEKVKEKNEHNKAEQNKVEDAKKDLNYTFSHLSKGSYPNTSPGGCPQKRKKVETNGFIHDNEVRPNKIARPISHPLTENGSKLEVFQISSIFTSDRQGAANNFKVDSKEHKLNGIIEPQISSSPTTKPSYSAIHVDLIVEASRKPPHPDSKDLSQVLLVPKMEEWSDFEDQEWLLSNQDPASKKLEEGYVGATEELRVSSEGMQIDSADIFALPYVIPY